MKFAGVVQDWIQRLFNDRKPMRSIFEDKQEATAATVSPSRLLRGVISMVIGFVKSLSHQQFQSPLEQT